MRLLRAGASIIRPRRHAAIRRSISALPALATTLLFSSQSSFPVWAPDSRRGPSLFFSFSAASPHGSYCRPGGSRSMSSFVTKRSGDGTITVAPRNEVEQSALVVICHGLGDTSEGFADVAEHLAGQMPYMKLILPTAPTQPVTMNMGMPMPSWYDIVGLDERSNEKCKGIEESRDRLRSILEKEHADTGLPYSRMVLAGFSQGGALSLYTGLQLKPAERKLAGVVLMSGYLAASKEFRLTPGLEDTPVLHCHGEADPMVIFDMARKSRQHLLDLGVKDYELKSYPGLVHSVNMEEIADVMAFLRRVLPADDSCRVKLKDPSEMSVKELKAAIKHAGLGSKAVGLMEKSEFVKLLKDHRDGKA